MTSASQSRLKSSDWLALGALVILTGVLVQRLESVPWEALIVTAGFAVTGWLLRGVNASGAIAGGLVALILYAVAGWRMFTVLFAVFVLTLLATWAGRGRKARLGVAEAREGRSAAQVGANLFAAAAALVVLPDSFAAAVALAVLAEAAADTVSSEIGEAFGTQTYLILTLRPTTPGVNGGVSLVGTSAGVAAAAAVASMGLLVMDSRFVMVAFGAGVLGMMMDSLLGASLEQDGYLNNDGVNLLGTATAAGVAALLR